jgi:hypothetical protein
MFEGDSRKYIIKKKGIKTRKRIENLKKIRTEGQEE